MTKLEEKLIELGYVKNRQMSYEYETYYFRNFDSFINLYINVEVDGYITHSYVQAFDTYAYQEQIDNLQQAFNQLQKDLKELKEYE